MITKLKKKMAVVLTGLMVLQLAFFGLGANPASAFAAVSSVNSTYKLSADTTGKVFVANDPIGTVVPVTIKTDILGDSGYSHVRFNVTVTTPEGGNVSLLATDSMGVEYDVAKTGYWGPVTGFPLPANVDTTTNFKVKFDKDGLYTVRYDLFDVSSSTVLATASSTANAISTVLVNTYSKDTLTSGPTTEFVNTVNINGSVYSDVLGHGAKGYVVLKREDGQAVAATDVEMSNFGSVGTEVVGSEKVAVSSDPNSLVLGWANFPLTDIFKDLVSEFRIKIKKEGTYDFTNLIFDTEKGSYKNLTIDAGNKLVIDGSIPTFTFSIDPTKVVDVKATNTLSIKADKVLLKNMVGTYSISLETVQGDAAPVSQEQIEPSVDGLNFTVVLKGLVDGNNQTIKVFVSATNSLGNKKDLDLTKPDFTFTLDTVAPKAIEGFGGNVNADGKVVLTWTNPTPNDSTKLVVVRDGVAISTLTADATTYTDVTTTKGVTYKYEIVAYDAAGNFTGIAPLSVLVPAPVVAPANQVAAVATDTATLAAPAADKQEVKSESTDNKTDDTKKSNLPFWGIILLIILAGVGGYLFLTQRPADEKVTMK